MQTRPPFKKRLDATEIENALRAHGLKATPQRVLALELLQEHPGHLTAAELIELARPYRIRLDTSTLYRTLGAAEDAGLVARFTSGTGDTQFEWIREPHFHFQCKVCGVTSELPAQTTEIVASTTSLQVEMGHLMLSGLCSECRTAGTQPST
jgi:Fur family peroxide stress response transcriptional regulator